MLAPKTYYVSNGMHVKLLTYLCYDAGGTSGDELPPGAYSSEDERSASQQVRVAVLRRTGERQSEALSAAVRHVR